MTEKQSRSILYATSHFFDPQHFPRHSFIFLKCKTFFGCSFKRIFQKMVLKIQTRNNSFPCIWEGIRQIMHPIKCACHLIKRSSECLITWEFKYFSPHIRGEIPAPRSGGCERVVNCFCRLHEKCPELGWNSPYDWNLSPPCFTTDKN